MLVSVLFSKASYVILVVNCVIVSLYFCFLFLLTHPQPFFFRTLNFSSTVKHRQIGKCCFLPKIQITLVLLCFAFHLLFDLYCCRDADGRRQEELSTSWLAGRGCCSKEGGYDSASRGGIFGNET